VGSDKALQAWSQIALQWYLYGSDTNAEAVLTFFDQQFCAGSVGTWPDHAVQSLLQSAALLDQNGQIQSLTSDQVDKYVKVRNAARAEAHRKMRLARELKLESLLKQISHTESSTGLGAPLLEQSFDDVLACVSSFVSCHAKSIGIHPFLKGLRTFCQRQISDGTYWTWSLKREVFMEAGDENFMESAVQMLGRIFCLSPCAETTAELESGLAVSDCVSWQLRDNRSDVQLRQILFVLPREDILEGRCSGEFVKSGRRRNDRNVHKGSAVTLCMQGYIQTNCAVL